MSVQFEYQLTTMPVRCFHSCVTNLRELHVPRVGDTKVDIYFWMNGSDEPEAVEFYSEQDEHGRYLSVRRYIRVPVELPPATNDDLDRLLHKMSVRDTLNSLLAQGRF